jgi:DHA1 family multidrug resistance protein-like MFS transporter
MALMALGLGTVALATGIVPFLLCVAVFSFGALLATPTQQTVAAELANPAALGSYFGVNALALAVGGGIGHTVGGWLYGLGQGPGMSALPWISCAVIGLSAALGLRLALRRL